MAKFLERQKMGRLATADEIAHLIIYLASDEVRMIFYLKTCTRLNISESFKGIAIANSAIVCIAFYVREFKY